MRNPSSTDLVVQNNSLLEPDSPESVARIESLKDELPALVDAGDAETIKRWRKEGNAASLAAKKLGFEREATALARQAVRCTAALAMIDVTQGSKTPHIALAAAYDRGLLEAVLDRCEGWPSDTRALRYAYGLGANFVSRSRVQALIRKRIAERKITISALGREAGSGVISLLYGEHPGCEWWNAKKLTATIDVDISHLPPYPTRRIRRKKNKSRWLTHTFRPGNGRWDEVGVRFIACRDEMTRADPDWVDKPGLYSAMEIVSNTIQREIRDAER